MRGRDVERGGGILKDRQGFACGEKGSHPRGDVQVSSAACGTSTEGADG